MAAGGSMSKKKQEEEILKSLREIAAVQSNKQCFDCGQKGPTYLNMTIGSFVCTACSGLLRGLNPPQRVKSVSMASFTPDEIEFIKARGNDFCRKVWLGQSSEPPPQYTPGARDEMKIRDLMALRYEKKRWYVAPTEALHEEARKLHSTAAAANKQKQQPIIGKNNTYLISATTTQQAANRSSPTTEPKPATTSSAQSNPVSPTSMISAPAPVQTNTTTKSFDLLADLGGDPFAQQPTQQTAVENGSANFANFGNFSSVQSSFPQPSSSTLPTSSFFPTPQASAGFTSQWASLAPGLPASSSLSSVQPPVTTSLAAPAEKYSAIAEIDGVFGQQAAGPLTGGNVSVNWNSPAAVLSGSGGGMFGSGNTGSSGGMSSTSAAPQQIQTANPFGANVPGSQPTSVANPFSSGSQQPSGGAGFPQMQPGGFMSAGGFPSQPFSQPNSYPGGPPPSYMQYTGGGFPQAPQAHGFSTQPSGYLPVSGFNQAQPSSGFGQPGGFGANVGGTQFGASQQPMFNSSATAGSVPSAGTSGGLYFGSNPVQSSANPFMASAPRNTNTSNPFL